MKKSKLFAAAGVLAVGAMVAFFWLGNPLNSLLKTAIEKLGSELTQTQVKVAGVSLSPSDGKGTLSGFSLGNPAGFKSDHAFKVNKIDLALEPSSLTEDVLLIHRIAIDAPDIIYEKNNGLTNFDAIQRNVEHSMGSDSTGSQKSKDSKPGKKMIIESLTIRNIKVNYNDIIELTLPDIELHNIGKKNGGATSAQVVKAIVSELNTKLAIALGKTAAITAVGGVAVGVGMGIKSLLGK